MAREADELMSRLEINLPGADVETGLMSSGKRWPAPVLWPSGARS